MNRRQFLVLTPALLVAGCGFELRRYDGLPFASLYLDAPAGSAVAQRLRTLLTAGGKTRLTATAAEAEAVLKLSDEARSKTILSLSGAGRVTEYRLGLRVGYRVIDRDGRALAETETIELTRDLTYDDTQRLAKGAEESLLYRDMDESAAMRILRRLQALRPANGRS
ncbi:MAG: LPS assembly lipoprotein LptE [Thiobacillus sp.]|nr:LPS assembly lipoprotein LptE [Thiobacillus sp.]